ncbi:hypothetical protein [Pseudosulfitobacter sp. SM2401]|uniref:hypothetical protein n=1 Tax=Pseudosulfitobacter sp. SM2401 TaxID=3350098 RepID=UPI0036F3B14F
MSDEQSFKRWQNVEFEYRRPTSDNRKESCRVHEESITVLGTVQSRSERSSIVGRAVVPSEKFATDSGASLALIRPTNTRLTWKRRTQNDLEKAKLNFERKASQTSFLDKELAAYEPCPFVFTMHYDDADGPHKKTCADWETAAAFFNLSKQMEEAKVLEHLRKTYTEDYVATGLVFTLGNMAKRPKTWQLMGIFPAKELDQKEFF